MSDEYKELYIYLNEQISGENKALAFLYEYCGNLPQVQQDAYTLLYIVSNFYELQDEPGAYSETACNIKGKKFSIDDFSDTDITLLSTLDFESIPLALASKTYAIMWLNTNDFKYAQRAADLYLQAFEEWFDATEWFVCVNALKHALFYAKKVNYQKCIESALDSLYNHVVSEDGKDPLFFTIEAITLLVDNKYCDSTKKQVCISILDNLINNHLLESSAIISTKIDIIEPAYLLKAKILQQLNKAEDSKNSLISYAELLVSLFSSPSDTRSIFLSEIHLINAIQLFRNNGKPDRAVDVHKILVSVQEKKTQHMQTFTRSFDVSKIYNSIQRSFKGLSFQEAVAWLSMITGFNDIDDTKKRLINRIHNSPIASAFPRSVMNLKGQIVYHLAPLDINNPESDEKLFWQHMYVEATEHNRMAGNTFLKYALDYIRSNYEFSEADLDFIFDDHIIIPKDRVRIWKKGLYLGLSGDIYSALHLLSPQIESYFRLIAELSGDVVVTLEKDGTSKDKVLSSIFELPELNDCYDKNIIFTFKGLLNENTGANFRNLIAHGILDEREATSGVGIALVCMTLKLLVLNSNRVMSVIKSSDKIQKNIKQT